MPLTDLEVRRAKAKERAYRMSDGGSLFLWVTPAGGKLWRWAYTHEGKEKLMAFGKYPDVPLALARERHSEARKLLAIGLDPMAQRKAAKTAEKAAAENSFRTIAGLWFEHWRAEKSAQHVDATRRRMDANIFPLLGAVRRNLHTLGVDRRGGGVAECRWCLDAVVTTPAEKDEYGCWKNAKSLQDTHRSRLS